MTNPEECISNDLFKIDIKTIVGVLLFIIVCCFLYKHFYSSPTKNLVRSEPTNVAIGDMKSKAKLKMFYSESCGFCQKQKQILQDNGLTDTIEMIDCSRNNELCSSEKIQGVPTFKTPSGKKVSGLQSSDKIKQLLQE